MNISKNIIKIIDGKLDEILSLRQNMSLKADNSFVSEGDLLVEKLIIDFLRESLGNHFIVSEEKELDKTHLWDKGGSYIFIDPIDGTENFISGLKEWGIGVSIFTDGIHHESLIYLPELDDFHISGMQIKKYQSRIIGISSSISKDDINNLPIKNYEFRITGCSMYNLLSAARGSFNIFENINGVNCWDVLPGINIALEHGCKVYIDNKPYKSEILFPDKKYKVKIVNPQT